MRSVAQKAVQGIYSSLRVGHGPQSMLTLTFMSIKATDSTSFSYLDCGSGQFAALFPACYTAGGVDDERSFLQVEALCLVVSERHPLQNCRITEQSALPFCSGIPWSQVPGSWIGYFAHSFSTYVCAWRLFLLLFKNPMNRSNPSSPTLVAHTYNILCFWIAKPTTASIMIMAKIK